MYDLSMKVSVRHICYFCVLLNNSECCMNGCFFFFDIELIFLIKCQFVKYCMRQNCIPFILKNLGQTVYLVCNSLFGIEYIRYLALLGCTFISVIFNKKKCLLHDSSHLCAYRQFYHISNLLINEKKIIVWVK